MSTRVAILGAGRMGSALARRLAGAGLEPVLWNRTRARAELWAWAAPSPRPPRRPATPMSSSPA